VEPVAQVGDVVEPQLPVGAQLLEGVAGEGVLQLPLVEIGPEEDGQQGTQTGVEQQQRRQPADRALRRETELGGLQAHRPTGPGGLRLGRPPAVPRGRLLIGHDRETSPGV
jgi:hypothetical protein